MMQRYDSGLNHPMLAKLDEFGRQKHHSEPDYKGRLDQWAEQSPEEPAPSHAEPVAKHSIPQAQSSQTHLYQTDVAEEGREGYALELDGYRTAKLNQESKPFEPQRDGAIATVPPSPPAATDNYPELGFTPVLRNRNFLSLWCGQVFSQLADKVYLVLMIMIITSQFQAAGQTVSGWVSSIMVAFTIPAVLFGSIAGVYVDHWSKKAVLVSTNVLRGALVLALPFLLWISHGWSPIAGIPVGFAVLLAITFFVSTLTQFFAPAEQAVIPLVVERRHLLSANSLYTTTMMASVIIGFAVGEPLLVLADSAIAHFGGGSTIGKELLVGLSYIAAGGLLLLIRTHSPDEQVSEDLPPVWENIRDGLRYLRDKPTIRAAMLQLVILSSIFAALAVLAVRLAEVMPTLKSSQFGFLLAAGGLGMAIGAIAIGHYAHHMSRSRLSLYGSLGMALGLAALAFSTHYLILTLLVLVGFGASAAFVGVPMQTAIQEETPEDMRGKVFGLQNNAVNIALSLPLALAGVAETVFGLRLVLLGLAGLAIVCGVLTWSLTRSELS
ncbi:MFS transporter [Leptolyngbya sp. AN02str]|uniref:MFS transporter n=1 Tax=Leptolyngbya sp. AN02str TaxID=3423363 RepID=UPI003D31F5C8